MELHIVPKQTEYLPVEITADCPPCIIVLRRPFGAWAHLLTGSLVQWGECQDNGLARHSAHAADS